jgi:hypothetical protein
MITAEQAKAIANSVSGQTKLDLSTFHMQADKTIEEIIRAEASQGKVRVEICVDNHKVNQIIARLLQTHFYACKRGVKKVGQYEIGILYVSWVLPKAWNITSYDQYLTALTE